LLYSYRSTGAITQLFNQLTTQEITIIPVRPLGKVPQYLPIDTTTDLNLLLTRIAQENQTTTLTLLAKTAQQATQIKEKLTLSEINVTVLPISLAKGLEFDHVVLYDVSSEMYHTPRDRRILYTALSRAMQTITLLYSQQLTNFLQ
jgi:DNA helicase-2/ATP-dependent DNA helicase PcrA